MHFPPKDIYGKNKNENVTLRLTQEEFLQSIKKMESWNVAGLDN